MATTTTNMSLQSWDQVGDIYDHAQLANNWSKVDQHNHTSGKGLQIPTGGIEDGAITAIKLASTPLIDTAQLVDDSVTSAKIADGTILVGDLANDAVEAAKIKNNAVTTAKILDANVTTAKILDANVTGAKLAATTLGRRRIFSHVMGATSALGVGTYFHGAWGAMAIGADAAGPAAFPFLRWEASEWAIPGKTTRWAVKCTCLVNGTGPATTVRSKLALVTGGMGASGRIGITTGSDVTNTIVDFTPAANDLLTGTVTPFAPPVDGTYAPILQVVGSGTAAGSITVINTEIFVTYV